MATRTKKTESRERVGGTENSGANRFGVKTGNVIPGSGVKGTAKGFVKSRFILPKEGPTEAGEEYAVGVIGSLPFHTVTMGGIAFPKYTDPPVGLDIDDEGVGTPQRTFKRGDVLKLTPTQVERVLSAVECTVYRKAGSPLTEKDREAIARGEKTERLRGFILRTTNARYRRQPIDEPMAKFVFMFKLADARKLGISAQWQTDRKVRIPSLWDLSEDDLKEAEK